jgi:hypothetical protein
VLHCTVRPSARPNPHHCHSHLLSHAPILRPRRATLPHRCGHFHVRAHIMHHVAHSASPSRPSTAVLPHHCDHPLSGPTPYLSVAATACTVPPATSTMPPGEGYRRPRQRLPRLVEDTTAGRSVCCMRMF